MRPVSPFPVPARTVPRRPACDHAFRALGRAEGTRGTAVDSTPTDALSTNSSTCLNFARVAYLFDPDKLHDVCRRAAQQGERGAIIDSVSAELKHLYPAHIELGVPWLFNNAGGAMGQIKLLHCSLSEYILIFGTPSGTEGHSGRYATEVFDFMLDGEMWCFHAGEFERTIFKPGDLAYLGADRAKGYAVPSDVLMLEYARGPIPTMLPFGLADTVFSTHDPRTIGGTLFQYARLVTQNLLRGKI
jgi:hypothetical protein